MTDPNERIAVSQTGGRKGVKLAAFDMIPADVLWALAEHYGRGEVKYPSSPTQSHPAGIANWRRGYPWSQSFAALQRHLWAFWGGEDYDPETNSQHLIAAAWHCLALAHFVNRADLDHFDDRQNGPVEP